MQCANYIQLLKYKTFGGSTSADTNTRNIEGNIRSLNNLYSNSAYNKVRVINWGDAPAQYQLFPVFGKGKTPVSIDDYILEDRIDNLNIISINVIYNKTYGESDVLFSYAIIVQNTTDAPIDVSEIGLFESYTSSAWTPNDIFMMYRETFPTVTIQPGESYTFTINFQ